MNRFLIYRKILFITFIVSVIASASAQEGLHIKYIFSRKMCDFIFVQEKTMLRDTVGYTIEDTKKIKYIFKDSSLEHDAYHHHDFNKNRPKRFWGDITNKSHDTLYIALWNFGEKKMKKYSLQPLADSTYIFHIGRYPFYQDDSVSRKNLPGNWRKFRYRGIDGLPKWYAVPYAHAFLGATTIPFRVSVWDWSADKDFLNANINAGYLWGRTRFYKFDDIKPRNFSFGLGLYLGFVEIEDSVSNKERLGLSWGINIVGNVFNNLSIIGSFGVNSNFGKKYDLQAALPNGGTNWKVMLQPYFGIGIGYKLYDIYQIGISSANKKDD